MPVSIEQHADWVNVRRRHLHEHGPDTIEALPEAEDDRVEHHNAVTATTLPPRANSGSTGWLATTSPPTATTGSGSAPVQPSFRTL